MSLYSSIRSSGGKECPSLLSIRYPGFETGHYLIIDLTGDPSYVETLVHITNRPIPLSRRVRIKTKESISALFLQSPGLSREEDIRSDYHQSFPC